MDVEIEQRERGDVPAAMFLFVPLWFLPLGAWLVQTGWMAFGTCGMKKLVGLPCLMCGATRATVHLLYGDVVSALAMQPFVTVAWMLLAVWGGAAWVAFQFDRIVSVSLSRTGRRLLAVAFIVGPLVNWAYLIQAGV